MISKLGGSMKGACHEGSKNQNQTTIRKLHQTPQFHLLQIPQKDQV